MIVSDVFVKVSFRNQLVLHAFPFASCRLSKQFLSRPCAVLPSGIEYCTQHSQEELGWVSAANPKACERRKGGDRVRNIDATFSIHHGRILSSRWLPHTLLPLEPS